MDGPYSVRVWDLPTRLFHWTLSVLVVSLFVSAWTPGVPVEWHARFGYCVLTLLLFRFAWGLVGGHWSRFRTFIPSLRDLIDYLGGRPRPEHLLGHSPLGALSVCAMLLVLAVQVGTGLVTDDEIAFTGPLNRHVSTATGLAATAYHKGIGPWLILSLVILHVLAIAFYARVRKRKLIPAMLHGDQATSLPGAPASRDSLSSRLLALGLIALSAALVALVVTSNP